MLHEYADILKVQKEMGYCFEDAVKVLDGGAFNLPAQIQYAHIFKARQKGQWELIISRSAAINSDHVISTNLYATKPEAKAAAKSINAKPWNY